MNEATEVPAAGEASGAAAGEGTAEAARRKRTRATAADMLRSMAVIVAVVGALVLLVPRPNSVRPAEVDVAVAAAGAAGRVSFPLAVPRGLPAGWRPTVASLREGKDGVPTWTLAYQTPTGHYAGIRQGGRPTPRWESTQVVDGPAMGTTELGGRTWIRRDRSDRGTINLVSREAGWTTIVTGQTSLEELAVLAAALSGDAASATPAPQF